MMLQRLLALGLVGALSSLVLAQAPGLPDGVGQPVPGRIAGTMSYVVTFKNRNFDLEQFRRAIVDRVPAAEVDQIVADLERKAESSQADFTAAVVALGGRITQRYWIVNGCAFEIAPQHIPTLAALPNVSDLHQDRTTMPLIKTSTNSQNHNADAVQAAGIKGVGVCTAIMDTGQDAVSGATGKPHATYYINGDTNNTQGGGIGGSRLVANVQVGSIAPEDPHNHGTAVASEVAGAIWNASGTADDGHAPLATIAGYSISNSTSGGSSEAVMAAAWQKIAADKAKYGIMTANNSYSGISCNTTDLIQKALDNAAWFADILVCTAAGNGASSTIYSQSTANGLSVAAVNATSKTMASFSCYGPLQCDANRFWPDISGCGVNTVMALRDNAASAWTASGTSMASPQVCGAATLVRSVNPTMSAQQTKALLLTTCESIAAQNVGKTRQNYGLGFVRDDLAVALAQVAGSTFSREMPNTSTIHTYQINVVAAKPYRVVICWPRRVDTSTSATWSNLKLRILDGTTVVATADTIANLYEFADFTPAASGTYTIEVSANSLEGGAPVEYSVAHNATIVGTVPGSFSLFGTSCAGSVPGGPLLSPAGVPVLGNNWRARVTKAKASSPSFFLAGGSNTVWGTTSLPLNLAPFGMNGCWLNVSIDVSVSVATDASGSADVYVRVPAVTTLLGSSLYVQWGVADPGMNGLGVVFTQGGKATVGGQL